MASILHQYLHINFSNETDPHIICTNIHNFTPPQYIENFRQSIVKLSSFGIKKIHFYEIRGYRQCQFKEISDPQYSLLVTCLCPW